MSLLEAGLNIADFLKSRKDTDLIPAPNLNVSQRELRVVAKTIKRRVSKFAFELNGITSFDGIAHFNSVNMRNRAADSLKVFVSNRQREVLGMQLPLDQQAEYINWIGAMSAKSMRVRVADRTLVDRNNIEAGFTVGKILEETAGMSFSLLTNQTARPEDINLNLIANLKAGVMGERNMNEALQENLSAFVVNPYSIPSSPTGPLENAA